METTTKRVKRVYLKNNLDKDYCQTIDGEEILIKAGEKKEFARSKAVRIRGHLAQTFDPPNNRYVNIPVNLTIEPIIEDEDGEETAETVEVESNIMERVAQLEATIARLNQPAKLYGCPFCDKDFASREGVKTHIGKAHKNETGRHQG